jgi:hypothetical protein
MLGVELLAVEIIDDENFLEKNALCGFSVRSAFSDQISNLYIVYTGTTQFLGLIIEGRITMTYVPLSDDSETWRKMKMRHFGYQRIQLCGSSVYNIYSILLYSYTFSIL